MAIAAKVEIDWNNNGTYTDESAYTVSAAGASRLQAPASFIASPRGQADSCTITLSNYSQRFDAATGDPIGTGSQLQMRVRVSTVIGATTTRIFTGVITGIEFMTSTPAHTSTVTLQCKSRDYTVLQDRRSTTRSQFAGWADVPPTEEEIIAQWLSDAGLTDGSDFIGQAYAASHSGSTATLDIGLFAIRWAWMDEESTLEEAWQLAAACGGRLYCDASGVMRYENMQHWALDSGSTALTRASFADMSLGYSDNELYNGITVETSGRYLTPSEVVWEPDDLTTVPAKVGGVNGTLTVVARLNQPLYQFDGLSYSQVSGGGLALATVTDSPTLYAQRAEIVFTNTSTAHAAVLPQLTMLGRVADGQRGEEVTAVSSDSYWTSRFDRNRSIRNNPYIQSVAQARALATMLRDWHQGPRITGTISGVADPTIGAGERVEITDATLLDAATEFYVLGVSWTLNQGGYNASLTLLEAAAIMPYADTSPGYFVIGTSELGAADAQRGRCFY